MNLSHGRRPTQVRRPEQHGWRSGSSAVVFSPDSKRLATASQSWVNIWDDRRRRARLQTLESHSSEVMVLAFSPCSTRPCGSIQHDGQDLGCCCHELDGVFARPQWPCQGRRSVRLIIPGLSRPLPRQDGHPLGRPYWCAHTNLRPRSRKLAPVFSADSKYFALTSGPVEEVKIRDVVTGDFVRALSVTDAEAIALSPDSQQIAVTFKKNAAWALMELWGVETGECILRFDRQPNIQVNSLAFSSRLDPARAGFERSLCPDLGYRNRRSSTGTR